jgi:(2Fe-2S) ferredoxin
MTYYKRHMFICTNLREDGVCCQQYEAYEKRAMIKQYAKDLKLTGQGKIRINTAGCLDRCDEGPVAVVYPDQVWYRYESIDDLKEIVDNHLINGQVVKHLEI